MTTNELIERLRELDPEGQRDVMTFVEMGSEFKPIDDIGTDVNIRTLREMVVLYV